MAGHLRFSIVYWHTMCGQGADMFGGPTAVRPWDTGKTGIELAKARVPVFFEIAEKLGMPFYAFHDRDVAPHGQTLRESNEYLDTIVALLKEQQQRTGIKLLWGTAQLRTAMHGRRLRRTRRWRCGGAGEEGAGSDGELGGEGYLLGRTRRLLTLWNTDMKRSWSTSVPAHGGGLR